MCPQKMFSFWVSTLEMRILMNSPAHLRICFMHCDTSMQVQISSIRLSSLTFQADCGSVKGAGVPAEEGTEHYLPRW